MFYLTYIASELRRRRGRTILTALGLAVGVGLVVTVNALSTGLDDAQSKVLKPLTGVGTDMSVSRPLSVRRSGNRFAGPPGGLSTGEQRRLRKENGGGRVGLRNLGSPGEHFTRDDFVTTTQLSFPESQARGLGKLSGVRSAAASLTLSLVHVSGTVPEQPPQQRGAPTVAAGPPPNVDFDSSTVTGVDQTKPSLGAVTPGQLTRGRYFSRSASGRQAILTTSYARRKGLSVGETFDLKGKRYTVIGLAKRLWAAGPPTST